ncbi:MAG TPA: class I SAM-dependent methyltransferase [Herpetosiphonaceae bacterium]|nr:class I SAM-dependent methyltransferase [Herpetosiphonaceae bacterium]
MTDSTRRFATRVDNYVKYRPSYPAAILDALREECGLTPATVIADIGSGTGILSELLLSGGNRVYGVEPNREMRAAGESLLADYHAFASVDGTAEATTLPDGSVDLITAGQAFHWFNPAPTRAEWRRILRPDGWVSLVWNVRRDDTAFLRDYEAVLQTYATDYNEVRHGNVGDEDLAGFYGSGGPALRRLPNRQLFDLEGLIGRVFSSSYTPEPGHPAYEPLRAALADLFGRHQRDGQVAFEYETRLYFGRL